MNRTKNGFDVMSLSEFLQTLGNICTKMDGNPNFPDLGPDVAALNTGKNAYTILAEKAINGSKLDIQARDAKRAEVVTQLRNLGNAITAEAKGDLTKLLSTGYPVAASRTPSAPLVTPVPPRLSTGQNKGEIACIAKRQRGVVSLIYKVSIDPTFETGTITSNSSKSKILFTGLASGVPVYVKYCLCGVRNQCVESDAISHIPQ